VKTIKCALVFAGAVLVTGCGGGGSDGAPNVSVNSAPDDAILMQAGSATETRIDGAIGSGNYLLASAEWQVHPQSVSNPPLTLRNANCSEVIKNDRLDPIAIGNSSLEGLGHSTWSCTLGVMPPSNVQSEALYTLLLVGTDVRGQTTTTTKTLRVLPAVSSGGGAATGLWSGSTNTNRTVTGVVLGDGTYYVLYSVPGVPSTIAGIVQGTGSVSGSTFASTNAKDFNFETPGVFSASVSATVISKQSLNGSITPSGSGAISFATVYDSDWEQTPTLSGLAGTYTGTVASSAGTESATVTVSASGAVNGTGASGCTVTGTATPRTDGNAFNITLNWGGAPCLFAGQTFQGHAYYDAVPDKRLFAAAPNAARTDGVLFTGTKP
jgi:hypothetical protein